jgi:hypothetical protein
MKGIVPAVIHNPVAKPAKRFYTERVAELRFIIDMRAAPMENK